MEEIPKKKGERELSLEEKRAVSVTNKTENTQPQHIVQHTVQYIKKNNQTKQNKTK